MLYTLNPQLITSRVIWSQWFRQTMLMQSVLANSETQESLMACTHLDWLPTLRGTFEEVELWTSPMRTYFAACVTPVGWAAILMVFITSCITHHINEAHRYVFYGVSQQAMSGRKLRVHAREESEGKAYVQACRLAPLFWRYNDVHGVLIGIISVLSQICLYSLLLETEIDKFPCELQRFFRDLHGDFRLRSWQVVPRLWHLSRRHHKKTQMLILEPVKGCKQLALDTGRPPLKHAPHPC